MTDSLTPRKFKIVSKTTPAMANSSLYSRQPAGKKLNNASAPLAMDIVIVST
jgi:hypothetical protein